MVRTSVVEGMYVWEALWMGGIVDDYSSASDLAKVDDVGWRGV